jgi:putative SOS response-associated peptidase YedK
MHPRLGKNCPTFPPPRKKTLKEWKANTINARIEGVAEAPSYRDAYRNGRCIVPMAGYYEWGSLTGDPKQPFYIQPKGNTPALLVCGLWSEATLPDFTGLTCAILTEPSRDDLARIHDRQPAIVDAEGARAWLEGATIEDVPRMPNDKLVLHKVSKRVNNWRAEDEGLIRQGEDRRHGG